MKKYSLDLVVVIVLFSIFAFSAVLLSVIGANVYRSTADTMAGNSDSRTSILYVCEKLRQNDIDDAIAVTTMDGQDALVITEMRSGEGHKTWIFVQDNKLWEGMFPPDAQPNIAQCEEIMPITSMNIEVDPQNTHKFSISVVTIEGDTQSVVLLLKADEVGDLS